MFLFPVQRLEAVIGNYSLKRLFLEKQARLQASQLSNAVIYENSPGELCEVIHA